MPKRLDRRLLRLLVTYQTLWDFLDNLSESGATVGTQNGFCLHRALVEALDRDAHLSDYYRFHPWHEDDGYLRALVTTCRRLTDSLPSYPQLRALVLAGVSQCALQGVNHLGDREQRIRGLKAWASQETRRHDELSWFEVAAASSAFLPHPLLALAAEPDYGLADAKRVNAAYFPWMALAITMLDSYADLDSDRVGGEHSYVDYYDTAGVACERLCEVVKRLLVEMDRLPSRDGHVVIAASMIAMYLSCSDGRGSPQRARMNKRIAASSGPLTQLLVPAARAWRTASAHNDKPLPPSRLPPRAPISAPLQTALFWRAPFAYLSHCRRRYGSRFTLHATSHPPLVFLSDPPDIRALVAASEGALRPGEGGATVSPIVGERSFMLSDGTPHRGGRKATIAAFHQTVIRRHGDMVARVARQALGSWPVDRVVAVHDGLRTATLEVILRTLTGRSEGELDGRLELLRHRVLQMLAVTQSATLVEPRLRHGLGKQTWRRFLHRRAQVDELLTALIADRRQPSELGCDLLGRLARLPNDDDNARDSARRLRDNVMSLVLAGHETTAAQLAWAFQLLAHNPSVRDRLIREVDADRTDEYLTATVQEVLRHRCVFVFSIPRAVAKPVEIGGWTYAPPAQLLACIYLLHHDAAMYRDPYEFRPERFLDSPPDPGAWMPWGGGRKRCPGLHLATLEMKIVLRTVLRERTPHAAARRMERPRWRSVIVAPHAGSRVVLARRR